MSVEWHCPQVQLQLSALAQGQGAILEPLAEEQLLSWMVLVMGTLQVRCGFTICFWYQT